MAPLSAEEIVITLPQLPHLFTNSTGCEPCWKRIGFTRPRYGQ